MNTTSNTITLAFTEVNDGTGLPAKYDVRLASPTIGWGSAPSVTSGTCSDTLLGTAIGGTKTCTVSGLSPNTQYQFQLIAYRGTLNLNAVFGGLSNIITAITLVPTPPTIPTPTPTPLVGDLNDDSIVNSLDWSIMNAKWFRSDARADLNNDGIVNLIDFLVLNMNWFRRNN